MFHHKCYIEVRLSSHVLLVKVKHNELPSFQMIETATDLWWYVKELLESVHIQIYTIAPVTEQQLSLAEGMDSFHILGVQRPKNRKTLKPAKGRSIKTVSQDEHYVWCCKDYFSVGKDVSSQKEPTDAVSWLISYCGSAWYSWAVHDCARQPPDVTPWIFITASGKNLQCQQIFG